MEWGARLQVSGIVVGEGYRFGYKAQGDTRMMAALCAKHQLKLHVAALVASSPGPGESVSSSKAGHLLTSFSAGSGGRNSLPHILCTFVDGLCNCIALHIRRPTWVQGVMRTLQSSHVTWVALHFCSQAPCPDAARCCEVASTAVRLSMPCLAQVRAALSEGDLRAVQEYLGRPYTLVAHVPPQCLPLPPSSVIR